MPVFQKHNPVVHLAANTAGRDFVVGDIHGCYNLLIEVLARLNIDITVDRVISVGDLVDRGPNSRQCAELVYQPWFYSIQGNHEQLMTMTLIDNNPAAKQCWLSNGGMWYLSEPHFEMVDLAKSIATLPYVFTVGEGDQRYNVVHAELIATYGNKWTDKLLDQGQYSDETIEQMVWGRSLISGLYEDKYHHDTNDLSTTFVGHTPIHGRPVKVGKQIYIDGGAVFGVIGKSSSENNALVIASPLEQLIYRYVPSQDRLEKISIELIGQR